MCSRSPSHCQLTTAQRFSKCLCRNVNAITIDSGYGVIFHLHGRALCVNLKEMTGVGVKLITFAGRAPSNVPRAGDSH